MTDIVSKVAEAIEATQEYDEDGRLRVLDFEKAARAAINVVREGDGFWVAFNPSGEFDVADLCVLKADCVLTAAQKRDGWQVKRVLVVALEMT